MARKRKKPASGKKKKPASGKEKKQKPAPGKKKRSRKDDLVSDDPPVIDLDEDGDDDPIEALIAQTVATAPLLETPDEVEPPVIDLDAELDAAAVEPTDATASPEGAPTTPDEPDDETPAAATAGPSGAGEVSAAARPDGSSGEASAEEAVRKLLELGPVSSPEIRDRLLAEALAHAEHKDARYRVPFSETPAAGRWKALVGLVLLLVAGLVALVPPGWATPEPPAQLAAPERARSVRVALLLQAEQVEAFRVREQRLPATLDEVAEALPDVRYVRSGTRAYQLIAYLPDGSAVVYDSASPGPAFDDLEPGWRPAEGVS